MGNQVVEEDDREWMKAGALEEIDHLKAIRATAWDEHTHSFRWLMASLLAMNGGACVALINGANIALSYKLGASGAFIIGILFALPDRSLFAIPVCAFADKDFPTPQYTVYVYRKHNWVAISEKVIEYRY